jgi:hypothetical protein
VLILNGCGLIHSVQLLSEQIPGGSQLVIKRVGGVTRVENIGSYTKAKGGKEETDEELQLNQLSGALQYDQFAWVF